MLLTIRNTQLQALFPSFISPVIENLCRHARTYFSNETADMDDDVLSQWIRALLNEANVSYQAWEWSNAEVFLFINVAIKFRMEFRGELVPIWLHEVLSTCPSSTRANVLISLFNDREPV